MNHKNFSRNEKSYTIISLPPNSRDIIEILLKENKWLGIDSVEEFILDSIRHRVEVLLAFQALTS